MLRRKPRRGNGPQIQHTNKFNQSLQPWGVLTIFIQFRPGYGSYHGSYKVTRGSTIYKFIFNGTSLVVQWLRLRTPAEGGAGSIPGWGAKIPHAAQRGQKKKKKSYFKGSQRDTVYLQLACDQALSTLPPAPSILLCSSRLFFFFFGSTSGLAGS